MTRFRSLGCLALATWVGAATFPSAQDDSVTIEVDARDAIGAMTPVRAWFGIGLSKISMTLQGGEVLGSTPIVLRSAVDCMREVRAVTSGNSVKISLAPGGGWAARVKRN